MHWVGTARVIAIVRGDCASHLLALAEGLYNGGIRAIEMTTNSPNTADMIAMLSAAKAKSVRAAAEQFHMALHEERSNS